ncbi:g4249 [Coccomyxa viridis]|uniref:G4249 protein n=1 Tax=Coccomyxa viridis TaxID=1274662 RepID=A0ABP1FWW3_9CHLO
MLVPDSYPNLPLNGLPYSSEALPIVTNSICCAQFLDSMTTRQHYIMVFKTLIGELFISDWVELLISVLAAVPETRARLLLDMIIEPDGYGFTWPGSSRSKCLRCYCIRRMDPMYPICPDCLFIGEGTGATRLAANWAQSGVSNASGSFNELLTRPYMQQVLVGPHIYCADVSGCAYATGQALYSKLDSTFSYLNLQGYYTGGGQPCHRYVTIIDELGSLFDSQEELDCFRSIVAFANNEAVTANGVHGGTQSWDSTGGILTNDNRTVQWFDISALTGGTTYMSTGLGLRPSYLLGFNPVQPITSVAPAHIDSAPAGAFLPTAKPHHTAASAKDSRLVIETVVPTGSVLLIAAISALAAQHC